MPELPEVEIVRRNLERWWQGEAADEVWVLDPKLLRDTDPDALAQALRHRCETAGRRGKYLFCELAGGRAVVFHFRMTGKIICADGPEPDYARLSWRVGDAWLAFTDPRRLGHVELVDALADYTPIQKMGPEPEGLDADDLRELLPERRMLKTALMDQEVIAGLGNIAASEVMWRLKVAPRAKVGELSDAQFDALPEAIMGWVEDTIAAESGDEVEYLALGRDDNPFTVYKRDGEPCPRCGTAIDKAKVGGRTSWYCPSCQS